MSRAEPKAHTSGPAIAPARLMQVHLFNMSPLLTVIQITWSSRQMKKACMLSRMCMLQVVLRNRQTSPDQVPFASVRTFNRNPAHAIHRFLKSREELNPAAMILLNPEGEHSKSSRCGFPGSSRRTL
jgi:hypothetical protein